MNIAVRALIVLAAGTAMLGGAACSQAPEESATFHGVEGLAYSGAGGSSGTTGEHGEFSYAAGDRVTFAIGELVLGAVDMGAGGDLQRVTPAHLVPEVGGDVDAITDQRVTNIARLVQSLDADGDPENGVTISPAASAAASSHSGIDFDQSPQAFEADPGVAALAGDLGVSLRAPEQARNVLRRTLRGIRKLTDVAIPTRDPDVQLLADVFLPLEPGPYPVVLSVTRYGKAFERGCTCDAAAALQMEQREDEYWENELGPDGQPRRLNEVSVMPNTADWVPEGYAVVRVDGRGTCNTPGFLHPYGAQEAEDIYDAIEWAGTQPWSNGNVGMWGISNTAVNQLPAATLQPPHLKALIPHSGDIDQYRDIVFQGGLYYQGYREPWFHSRVAGEELRCLDQPYADIIDIFRENRFDDPRVYGFLDTDPDSGELLPIGPASPDPSKITQPLWSHSRQDMWPIHIRGGSEVYILAASEHKKLWVEAGHEYARAYAPDVFEQHVRFFDHWLKGVDNGIMDEPPVRVDLRLPRDADNPKGAWKTRFEDEWPIARTQYQRLYLDATDPSGDGVLLAEPPPQARSTSYSADVSDDDCDSHGVSFISEPLEADTELAGYMKLGLTVSSSSADMDIYATLRVMDEQGQDVLYHSTHSAESPVTVGFLKVSHRKLDEARSTHHQPVLSHKQEDHQPLTPGEPVTAEVELWPNTALIKKGHRLWLTLQPRDSCFRTHTHEYDESYHRGASNTIHTGGAEPAYLQIPVVPPLIDN
ncbi:MAG: CocE/NonD family hydrolase [Acidobacteria bacterium]|nr:CocE/NonD family hydrolase [Acidobacteriota bacterium]